MNEKHKEMSEDLFLKVSMHLAENGKVSPIYVMILKDDTLLPILLSNSSEVSIIEYATAANSAAQEMDASALIFISEQSMVKRKKDDPETQVLVSGMIKASDHPDKKDYLTLVYVSENGKCNSLISKIHSDPVGTKYTLDSKWVDYATTNLIRAWKM